MAKKKISLVIYALSIFGKSNQRLKLNNIDCEFKDFYDIVNKKMKNFSEKLYLSTLNGNGKIDYVMVEGDPENVDAQYRTEYSVKALEDAGLEVNQLDDQVGNWDQATAQQLVANDLSQFGDDVEVVFCNNDAMALGALQSIEAAGRTVGDDIFLVGVDALSEALDKVEEGKMTGTVFNDHISQSHSAADAAVKYLAGEENEHYIGCDYVKVTTDNVADIKEMTK